MSHAARAVMPKMKDMKILERAVASLGWTTKRDAQIRAWYGTKKKYDLVLVNPNSNGYDLGVMRNSGSLVLEGDLSMLDQKATQVLGNNFDILKQAYQTEAIIADYESQGANVLQHKLPNGVVELEIELQTVL